MATDEKARDGDEKVLVERDGQFELVNASEVKAPSEKPDDDSKRERDESEASETLANDSNRDIEEVKSEPAIQLHTKTRQGAKTRPSTTRATKSRGDDADDGAAFQSWLARKKLQSSSLRRRSEAEQRETEAEKRRKAEEAFRAWLAQKDEQMKARRRREGSNSSQFDGKPNKEKCREVFNAWLLGKSEQQKREKTLRLKRDEMIEEATKRTSSAEAEKAFRM